MCDKISQILFISYKETLCALCVFAVIFSSFSMVILYKTMPKLSKNLRRPIYYGWKVTGFTFNAMHARSNEKVREYVPPAE